MVIACRGSRLMLAALLASLVPLVGCAKGNDSGGTAGTSGTTGTGGSGRRADRRSVLRAAGRQGAARPGQQAGRHDGRDGSPAGREPRRVGVHVLAADGGRDDVRRIDRAKQHHGAVDLEHEHRAPAAERALLAGDQRLADQRRRIPLEHDRLRGAPAPAQPLRRAGPALVGARQHGDHGRLGRQPAGHDGVRRSRDRLLDVGRDNLQERSDGDLRPLQRADPERQRPLRERVDHARQHRVGVLAKRLQRRQGAGRGHAADAERRARHRRPAGRRRGRHRVVAQHGRRGCSSSRTIRPAT